MCGVGTNVRGRDECAGRDECDVCNYIAIGGQLEHPLPYIPSSGYCVSDFCDSYTS